MSVHVLVRVLRNFSSPVGCSDCRVDLQLPHFFTPFFTSTRLHPSTPASAYFTDLFPGSPGCPTRQEVKSATPHA